MSVGDALRHELLLVRHLFMPLHALLLCRRGSRRCTAAVLPYVLDIPLFWLLDVL